MYVLRLLRIDKFKLMLARFKFISSQIFIYVFKEYRHVWFLRTVSENTENTNFMLSKNCSYSFNLVFSVFFKTKKKMGAKHVFHDFYWV